MYIEWANNMEENLKYEHAAFILALFTGLAIFVAACGWAGKRK